MKADLGTLTCVIEAGRKLREQLPDEAGANPAAFRRWVETKVDGELGEFLIALDSLKRNTRVLALSEVEIVSRQ